MNLDSNHAMKKKVWTLDGDKFKFRYNYATRKGGNGYGLSCKNVMFTLNTIDQHMVAILYVKRKRDSIREGCKTYCT